MSIVQLQRDLESVPDQFLAQESQQPSGQYPLYLVAAEIQRRTDLRDRFAQQQQMGKAVQPSVVEQRLGQMMQQGIGGAMAPPQGGQMPPQMAGGVMQAMGAPQEQPVQGFQIGGRVVHGPGGEDRGIPEWRGAVSRDILQPPTLVEQPSQGDRGWLYGLGAPRDWTLYGDRTDWMIPGAMEALDVTHAKAGQPQLADNFMNRLASLRHARVETDAERQARLEAERLKGLRDYYDEFARNFYGEQQGTIAEYKEASAAGEADVKGKYEDYRTLRDKEIERLDAATAVEDALALSQKDPNTLAQERRTRALGQLGALIGGSTAVGDIASGMGGINETLYGMKQEQDAQQQEIALALATAKDARQLKQTEMVLQGGREDIAAAVGSLERVRSGLQTIATMRSSAGQAVAQLMDASARLQVALLEYGTRNANKDSVLDAIDKFTSLLGTLSEAAPIEGDPGYAQWDQLTRQAYRAVSAAIQTTGLADTEDPGITSFLQMIEGVAGNAGGR